MIRLYSVSIVTRIRGISLGGPGGTSRGSTDSFGMMAFRRLLLFGLLPLIRAGVAPAQAVRVPAPGGTLTGIVRDSASGQPIGYALVVLANPPLRVFASEGG